MGGILRILLPLLIFITGCGYTFIGSGSSLPADVRSVYIPFVTNLSSDTYITSLLTEALREEFEKYGALKVVDSTENYDAVLNVTILSVGDGSRTVTANTETELQSDLTLTLQAELLRRDGTVLWANPNLSQSRSYASDLSTVLTGSANFAQSGMSAGDLRNLGGNEISRSQQRITMENLIAETSKRMYMQAVAPSF
ncbi:MAG: LPS assembly lipoprotein LptE [Bdellovibrionota bacterium]